MLESSNLVEYCSNDRAQVSITKSSRFCGELFSYSFVPRDLFWRDRGHNRQKKSCCPALNVVLKFSCKSAKVDIFCGKYFSG